ncbi:MAG: NAD(P)H-dependent oxidoreductase [Pseudomonadota bacterium]
MGNILVVSGHPDLASSNANQLILEALSARLDGISITRLDQRYPDYRIDIEREQAALRRADIVVLQFPFYWYSVPALLKKWIDDVFAYGFAYGSTGDKLQGKILLASFTIGGPSDAYQATGYNHFSLEQLLRPLEQTAYLAGMTFESVYSHGMVYIPQVYNRLDEVKGRAQAHAEELISVLNKLRSPRQLESEIASVAA